MKQLIRVLILSMLALLALPALAQDNANIITLNDATPAIDVVISLPADATGTISLDMANALVTLKDAAGNIVFRSADSRIYALEMNILPNSGTHTMTVERLAGFSQAFVTVNSLPELTIAGTVTLVDSPVVTLNQEASFPLDNSNPGKTVNVSIPAETEGIITASFFGTSATTQLLDANGLVLAESAAGHIDGLNFVLAGGDYQFTMLSSNLSQPVVAGLRVLTAVEGGFGTLAAQTAAASVSTNPDVAGEACYATIAMSSVNLRSGPGTGYSVIAYAYRDQRFLVGGRNELNNWVLIAKDDGSTAWMSSSTSQFEGTCSTLTVFNIPTRDAQPAQVIITTAEPSVVYTSPSPSNGSVNSNNNNGGGEHEDDDHEEDDDD